MIKRKKDFMEHTYSAIQLCLSDEVLRDVVEGTTTVELLTNLKTLYITKSLMN
jgi:hypothetical protein